MADYTHTIDRWDEATGENLMERRNHPRRSIAGTMRNTSRPLARPRPLQRLQRKVAELIVVTLSAWSAAGANLFVSFATAPFC